MSQFPNVVKVGNKWSFINESNQKIGQYDSDEEAFQASVGFVKEEAQEESSGPIMPPSQKALTDE